MTLPDRSLLSSQQSPRRGNQHILPLLSTPALVVVVGSRWLNPLQHHFFTVHGSALELSSVFRRFHINLTSFRPGSGVCIRLGLVGGKNCFNRVSDFLPDRYDGAFSCSSHALITSMSSHAPLCHLHFSSYFIDPGKAWSGGFRMSEKVDYRSSPRHALADNNNSSRQF